MDCFSRCYIYTLYMYVLYMNQFFIMRFSVIMCIMNKSIGAFAIEISLDLEAIWLAVTGPFEVLMIFSVPIFLMKFQDFLDYIQHYIYRILFLYVYLKFYTRYLSYLTNYE